jgi:hypothetical protein
MPTIIKNQEATRGDIIKYVAKFTNSATFDAGAYNCYFTIRKAVPSQNITNDNDAGAVAHVVTNATLAGTETEFSVSFLVDLSSVEKGNYYYDIQIVQPDGQKRTTQKGEYKVTYDITRT